jgi:predicted metal-dependent HD superfamily phosphohydrolase
MSSLEVTFKTVSRKYVSDESVIEKLWERVLEAYSKKGRYYHNLAHLNNLLNALQLVHQQIQDWDSVVFALVFHDIVYKVHRNDNEERSAVEAKKALLAIGVLRDTIDACVEMILATKSHTPSQHVDTNLFTDADLSILGASWDQYFDYLKAVRQEYKLYPDLIYRPGRIKVLKHFLSMARIFKTADFYGFYEAQARSDLSRELHLLSGNA